MFLQVRILQISPYIMDFVRSPGESVIRKVYYVLPPKRNFQGETQKKSLSEKFPLTQRQRGSCLKQVSWGIFKKIRKGYLRQVPLGKVNCCTYVHKLGNFEKNLLYRTDKKAFTVEMPYKSGISRVPSPMFYTWGTCPIRAINYKSQFSAVPWGALIGHSYCIT